MYDCAGNLQSFDEIVTAPRSVGSHDPNKKTSEVEVRTLIATAQEAPSWANVQATRHYAVIVGCQTCGIKAVGKSAWRNL